MLASLKRLFTLPTTKPQAGDADSGHDVLVAVCALLLEMGRIDESFTEAERDTVLSVLKDKYGLSTEDAEALVEAADRQLEDSIDYWHFAKRINDTYSTEEKIAFIEMLWTVVFVDGRMDRHEHYLMNKFATLLRLTHQQLIDAKLKIMASQNS